MSINIGDFFNENPVKRFHDTFFSENKHLLSGISWFKFRYENACINSTSAMWIFNQTAIQLIILKIQHVITCCLWTHCAVIIHLVTLNFLIFISKLSVTQHPSLILSNTCICNCFILFTFDCAYGRDFSDYNWCSLVWFNLNYAEDRS